MRRIVASLPALTTAVAVLLAMSPSYGQNTVILGCVNKSSGEIKIVSTAGQCKSNEVLISWNQTGIPIQLPYEVPDRRKHFFWLA